MAIQIRNKEQNREVKETWGTLLPTDLMGEVVSFCHPTQDYPVLASLNQLWNRYVVRFAVSQIYTPVYTSMRRCQVALEPLQLGDGQDCLGSCVKDAPEKVKSLRAVEELKRNVLYEAEHTLPSLLISVPGEGLKAVQSRLAADDSSEFGQLLQKHLGDTSKKLDKILATGDKEKQSRQLRAQCSTLIHTGFPEKAIQLAFLISDEQSKFQIFDSAIDHLIAQGKGEQAVLYAEELFTTHPFIETAKSLAYALACSSRMPDALDLLLRIDGERNRQEASGSVACRLAMAGKEKEAEEMVYKNGSKSAYASVAYALANQKHIDSSTIDLAYTLARKSGEELTLKAVARLAEEKEVSAWRVFWGRMLKESAFSISEKALEKLDGTERAQLLEIFNSIHDGSNGVKTPSSLSPTEAEKLFDKLMYPDAFESPATGWSWMSSGGIRISDLEQKFQVVDALKQQRLQNQR